MSKRLIKLTEGDYKYIRGVLIPIIDFYEDTVELTIVMNNDTKEKIEYHLEAPIFHYLFGVKIKINNIKEDTILFVYNDSENDYTKNPTLPDKYIVNKDAAILLYGNNKTIVKRFKGDKVDPVKAFLWAYFLRNTGMSRTKANKYLQKYVKHF